MRTNKGFTLTEVLLGIMIVGIIGIALAALTTSASRDSGQSSSKIMLRNNLSIFLRALRQDIHDSSRLVSIATPSGPTTATNVLVLGKKQTISGDPLPGQTKEYIVYCFTGTGYTNSDIKPSGSYIGGQIKRYQLVGNDKGDASATVASCVSGGKVVLNNVKYIASPKYPYFEKVQGTQITLGSILNVRLILEIPSSPVVNDAVEDVFVLPNGF